MRGVYAVQEQVAVDSEQHLLEVHILSARACATHNLHVVVVMMLTQ